MSTFLVAWALCMVAACFVITAVVVAVEVRDYRASKAGRVPVSSTPAPRVSVQRVSSAAVVHAHDPEAFDAFLGELIVTPHVEEALR